MVAFFPWLNVGRDYDFGDFQLVAFQREQRPAGPETAAPDPALQATLDAVLAPFLAHTRPVNLATLLRVGAHGLTDDLNEQERELAFLASELIAFGGLATREFFEPLGLHEHYCNFDNFTNYVQGFRDLQRGSTLSIRRRDVGFLSFVAGDAYRVDEPPHVSAQAPTIVLDEPLIRGLLGARARAEWPSFDEALFGFNRANTDNATTREHFEAVMMVGAFARLLDIPGPRMEEPLAQTFVATFQPAQDLRSGAAPRGIRFPAEMPVREAWIRDFVRLRHGPAHGIRDVGYPSVWPLREHLLLGAYAFPLLVKRRLQALHLYALTDQDRANIDVFERLAAEDAFAHLGGPDDAAREPAWTRIRDQVRRERRRAAAVLHLGEAAAQNREADDPDEPDGTFQVIQALERACPECRSPLQLVEARANEPDPEPWRYVRCSNLRCGYTERADG